MKKIIATISLITVLLSMMCPVSAASYETALDYAFGSGMGVKVVTVPTAAKTPVADGVIGENEYSMSYNSDPNSYFPMNGNAFSKVVASFEDAPSSTMTKNAIKAGVLDIEKLVKDIKLTFSFAQDEENIYVAVKYDAGVIYRTDGNVIQMETAHGETFKAIKHIISRYALTYRLGFNMEDADEYVEFETNIARTDLMATGNAKITFSYAGTDGPSIKDTGAIAQWYRTVTATETGWEHQLFTSIYKAGQDAPEANISTDHVVCDELKINKKALLETLNENGITQFEEMPNAMFFSIGIDNKLLVGENAQGERGFLNSDGNGGCFMLNGAKSEYEKSVMEIFPDLIVFTDKTTATKADVKTGLPAPETTDTTPHETTTPPTTATDTVAPTDTTADTTAPAGSTVATTEAPEKNGCGGTVTVAGIALVATLGTCAVFIEKKKRH